MTATPHDKALAAFTEYFVRNYPGPDTVIFDPKWHAPKLFNAAMKAIEASGGIVCAREPAEHQRLVPGFGWQRVNEEDVAHYGAKGIQRRTLHAPLSIAGKGDGWIKIPEELPIELLKSINIDNQVMVYENGQYYNAWFEFEPSEGGWFWTDDADSEPNPTHYCPLPAPPSLQSDTEGENHD